MAVEDHPLYPAWNAAFDRLVETERRYHRALMGGASEEEIATAARDLDEARTKYQAIDAEVEEYAAAGS
jgi:hypothetical protein